MTYIDTSVLAAYYCPEPFSAKAQAAIQKCEKPVISPLVEVELCSAIALKARIKELDVATGNLIISTFKKHLNEGLYRIVPIETKQYSMARDWLSQFAISLRALDALHLAAAFTRGLTLLTSDKALAQAAKYFGVSCEYIS